MVPPHMVVVVAMVVAMAMVTTRRRRSIRNMVIAAAIAVVVAPAALALIPIEVLLLCKGDRNEGIFSFDPLLVLGKTVLRSSFHF